MRRAITTAVTTVLAWIGLHANHPAVQWGYYIVDRCLDTIEELRGYIR